ncbi:MAG: AbrB/MazE/SpoVT family DNA-binding domain-containing protein [Nitrospira sp.]|nr:AbrB/MazE/SpoVT family DNA-binding domain-containing protein [Nitrospira sp.]MDH5193321.1 AbrB/MazE/SpoVT family DNA-binding domain-containing protein [Nitrospira sp.]
MTGSTITRKGQVTIPKTIRDRLGMREGEKVLFIIRGDDVVLKVVRGTILDLKGSVTPVQRPEDFESIRQSTQKSIATRLGQHD